MTPSSGSVLGPRSVCLVAAEGRGVSSADANDVDRSGTPAAPLEREWRCVGDGPEGSPVRRRGKLSTHRCLIRYHSTWSRATGVALRRLPLHSPKVEPVGIGAGDEFALVEELALDEPGGEPDVSRLEGGVVAAQVRGPPAPEAPGWWWSPRAGSVPPACKNAPRSAGREAHRSTSHSFWVRQRRCPVSLRAESEGCARSLSGQQCRATLRSSQEGNEQFLLL
jgi:hypothetical protein